MTRRTLTMWGAMIASLLVVITLLSCATHVTGDAMMTSALQPPQRVPAEDGAVSRQRSFFDGGPQPPNEELWIIAGHNEPAPQSEATLHFDDREVTRTGLGSGALLAYPAGQTDFVPAPLQHTDVRAEIAGAIASVEVEQTFANPFDVKIEAVYVFPLPQNSAVSEFVMEVGDRRIRGIVREREEAEQIYREARHAGLVASLMTQERPNIFTQKVANIEPGRSIDIDITYYHTLAYVDGWYEFVFPMTVGPRYNPPGTTTGVGAVGRSRVGRSGQETEVVFLSEHERTGHDIDLEVRLDAGTMLGQVYTPGHEMENDLSRLNEGLWVTRLKDRGAIPNKDFVLRYRLRDDRIAPVLVTHRDDRSGYFALTLHPPAPEHLVSAAERMPLEIIFVVDTSGSMRGRSLEQAKDAIRHTLRQLGPDDAYQIIRFSNDASPLGDRVVLATQRNVLDTIRTLSEMKAGGGTEMLRGVRTALNYPHDLERLRFVCFLTDGYIGNESRVLEEVHRELGSARLFSFGIGSAPNRFLMERLAIMGRGAVAYLSPDDSGADTMDAFLDRVRTPALADLSIDWNGLPVTDLAPARLPDLYAGRPVTVTGRFDPSFDSAATIRVHGRTASGDASLAIPFETDRDEHPALADLWARTRIASLIDEALRTPGLDPSSRIRRLALDHALLSPYTAFIAVDTTRVTEGSSGVTTVQPVRLPEGVRYHTKRR